MPEHRVVEDRERLHGADLVVVDDGELAERLLAVRQHRVRRMGAVRETTGAGAAVRIGTDDQGRQVGVHQVEGGAGALEHRQDRRAGLRVTRRVDGVVVEHRLAGRGVDRLAEGVEPGREVHVRAGDLAAIEGGARRLDVDRAEKAGRRRAAVAVAAGHGAGGVHHVLAFTLGVEGVGGRAARSDQAAPVRADVGAVVGDRVHGLEADHVDPGLPGRRLLGVDRRRVEQVLELDLQAVAHGHAQHHRPWALVLPQHHVARDETLTRIDGHHVAPQRVDHALGLNCAQAVPEEHLVERHHVGSNQRLQVAAWAGVAVRTRSATKAHPATAAVRRMLEIRYVMGPPVVRRRHLSRAPARRAQADRFRRKPRLRGRQDHRGERRNRDPCPQERSGPGATTLPEPGGLQVFDDWAGVEVHGECQNASSRRILNPQTSATNILKET